MIMSTDIAMAHFPKAQLDVKVSKGTMTIVCLWAGVGLVLAVLMAQFGFDAEIAAALATAG
jgi:hypothetical protein